MIALLILIAIAIIIVMLWGMMLGVYDSADRRKDEFDGCKTKKLNAVDDSDDGLQF